MALFPRPLGCVVSVLLLAVVPACDQKPPKTVDPPRQLTIADVSDPGLLDGKPVIVTGMTRNAGGSSAAVDMGGGVIVFVEDMTTWPDDQVNKKVSVTGIATIIQMNMDAAGRADPKAKRFTPKSNRWIVISNPNIEWK